MRSDFIKVLTERPRAHGVYDYHDKRKRGPVDLEDAAFGKEGMRQPYGRDGKEFSDLINPLYRYVQSRVGKNWDKTYSEICRHLKGRNTVQQHLLQHLNQYVETPSSDIAPRYRLMSDFYVDANGVLQARKQVNWRKAHRLREAQKPITKFKTDDGREYENINGVWYQVWTETKKVWLGFYDQPSSFRWVDRTTRKKRQLSTKELRSERLENATDV